MESAVEELRALAKEMFIRDARKLHQVAKSRNIPGASMAVATEALKDSVARQVLAPKPRSLGKSAAEGPDSRFQADLVDFSQNTNAKKHGGNKYAVLTADVFTRELRAVPLKSKNPAVVTGAVEKTLEEL